MRKALILFVLFFVFHQPTSAQELSKVDLFAGAGEHHRQPVQRQLGNAVGAPGTVVGGDRGLVEDRPAPARRHVRAARGRPLRWHEC